MNDEVLKQYKELKRNRDIIKTIEPNFFFKIVDYLLQENELAKQTLIKNCNIADERNQLLKENETLKNLHIQDNKHLDFIMQHSIPAQKVKDKIEHYQKLQDNYIEKYDEINEGLQAMINALQELLEGRK
jgi:hypothetical protein